MKSKRGEWLAGEPRSTSSKFFATEISTPGLSAQLRIAFRIVDMNSPVIISKFLTAIWPCVWIKLVPEETLCWTYCNLCAHLSVEADRV
jgi:hypothetical protein